MATPSSSRRVPARDRAILDEEFEAQGATIVPNAGEVFGGAEMILKVKEPQPIRNRDVPAGPDPVHLPPSRGLSANGRGPAEAGRRSPSRMRRCSCRIDSLPLLAPMSEIAGRMAAQVGAYFLGESKGGTGSASGRGHRRPLGQSRRDRREGSPDRTPQSSPWGCRRMWSCSTRISTSFVGWTRCISAGS